MLARRDRWFPNLAAVPGVGYAGDPVRRARLPESKETPRETTYNFGGRETHALSWRSAGGSTSASPVHRRAHGDFRRETSAEARERVLDAIELPGTISDYHFALQGVAAHLYQRRETELDLLGLVEWLALLDISVVAAHPDEFRISPAENAYVSITSLDILQRIYLREGFLLEALDLAERMQPFVRTEVLTELRARVANLASEQ